MIHRILVPLDGSKAAEQALSAARGLATTAECEIVLLTTIARMERWATSETPAWEAEEETVANRYLDAVAGQLRDEGFQVTTRFAWGRPADVIREVAEEANIDLIVMTTHGRSGLARWLIGSVTDSVLRTSERPLLLIRAQEEAPPPLKVASILVPLDGSHLAESGLAFVKDLATQFSAKVILERVIVPPTLLYAEQYLPSASPVITEMEAEAQSYLEIERERMEDTGLTVMVNVDDGYAVETIIAAADHFDADLIALTTHGRTGPARTILGSVADGLVRKSQRPCLVIPARTPDVEDMEAGPPSMLGIEPPPTVIPPPVMTETAAAKKPRAKSPPARQRRGDVINKQKG